MEFQKVFSECESKSYSIPEIKLYSFPQLLIHCIPEYLKENGNFLVYNTKCIHSWIALLKYVCRKRLPSIIETKLIYYLKKDIISASIYDTSLFKYMPDIDVYIIEDEGVNEEEFVPCTVAKYNIDLENYLECFKDVKRLPLGVSKKKCLAL